MPKTTSTSSTATILDEIITATKQTLETRRQAVPQEILSRRAHAMGPTRDFVGSLRRTADSGVNIIAEIKKASPSKGVIRTDFFPLQLARELAAAGAAALSIITEPSYFQGSLRYLRIIADNLDIPLLRKDFIVDPYQVYEARLAGADAILLIAAALPPLEFIRLAHLARELGLAVLAEVHTEQELAWVLELYPDMVGVNSRDLKSFNTNLKTTRQLLAMIPDPIVRVAESGIHDYNNIAELEKAGADAFLVGETLMRAAEPAKALAELRGVNEVLNG